jgi:hypothetical protein
MQFFLPIYIFTNYLLMAEVLTLAVTQVAQVSAGIKDSQTFVFCFGVCVAFAFLLALLAFFGCKQAAVEFCVCAGLKSLDTIFVAVCGWLCVQKCVRNVFVFYIQS